MLHFIPNFEVVFVHFPSKMVNCFSALWSRQRESREESTASEKSALISEKGTSYSVESSTGAPFDSTARLSAIRALMIQKHVDAL